MSVHINCYSSFKVLYKIVVCGSLGWSLCCLFVLVYSLIPRPLGQALASFPGPSQHLSVPEIFCLFFLHRESLGSKPFITWGVSMGTRLARGMCWGYTGENETGRYFGLELGNKSYLMVLIPSYLPLVIVTAGLVNIQVYEVWHLGNQLLHLCTCVSTETISHDNTAGNKSLHSLKLHRRALVV